MDATATARPPSPRQRLRSVADARPRPSRTAATPFRAEAFVRVLFVVIATLSVANFNPALVPGGMPNLQQAVVLLLWAALAFGTTFTAPVLHVEMRLDALATLAFYGFAAVSVFWSEHSAATLLKGGALAATTLCAFRVATRMRIDDIVDGCIVAFTVIVLASVLLVVFVPAVGIDSTWMHSGEWQGVFESKQSLGTVSALLMFFIFHRLLTRGGWLSSTAVFVLGLAGVIGSGSRGGGALALAACAFLFLGSRSTGLVKWLSLGPVFMCALAVLLIGYLHATGYAYLPLFGVQVDFTERTLIWQHALRHLGDHPLLGFGLNGFWSIDRIFHDFEREHGWVLDNFHDGYIAILTETGIVGLALFSMSSLLFGLKMRWITQHGVLRRVHVVLVLGLVNLVFFIDFTETFFLRSTNIVSILLVTFLFVACAAPATAAYGARPGARNRLGMRPRRLPAFGARRRMHVKPRLPAWLLAAALALVGTAAAAHDDPAFRAVREMGRGINVLGYDGIWEGGVDAPFKLSHFRLIRRAGFRHVRINVFGFKHMDAQNRLDAVMLEALDRVVEAALAAGLVPVIDEHDSAVCQGDPAVCAVKLRAFWSQISARYAGRYPRAIFEILNEPGGAMTAASWNDLSRGVLDIIRATNRTRTVVVAVINAEAAGRVGELRLPADDRNLIVTVHYYKPISFTHQGAPWSARFARLHGLDWGRPADRRTVLDDFATIDGWAKAQDRPIYLGEFGVFERAPRAARARYIGFLAGAAESLGWSWAYWQFDHDFAAFDEASGRWMPAVLGALVAPAAARTHGR